MQRSWAWTIACLALGAGLPAPDTAAQDVPGPERYALRFEYRQWRPELTSELRYARSGLQGTLIDGQRDLGLADENTYELRGSLQFAPGHRLRVQYTPLEYAGDARVSRRFEFGGTVYSVSTRVVTALEGRYLLGGYEWDFLRRPNGVLGLMVQGGYFDGEARVDAPEVRVSERQSVGTPLGAVGLSGRVYAGRLSFQGEFGGIAVGQLGHLWELDLSARLHVSDHLAAQVGYRALDVRAEDEPDLAKARLRGLTFGAEVSF